MQSAVASLVSAPYAKGKLALVVRPGQPVQRVMRIEPTVQELRAEASPEDLMAAIADRRDRLAFVRLFELFGPRVKAYLIRQGADRATAEDLVQGAWLEVRSRTGPRRTRFDAIGSCIRGS